MTEIAYTFPSKRLGNPALGTSELVNQLTRYLPKLTILVSSFFPRNLAGSITSRCRSPAGFRALEPGEPSSDRKGSGAVPGDKNPPARGCSGRSRFDSGRSQRWLAVSDGWKAHPIMLLIGWRLCAESRPSPAMDEITISLSWVKYLRACTNGRVGACLGM
jgi:hypothetical protein